jgi:hypothetical protein
VLVPFVRPEAVIVAYLILPVFLHKLQQRALAVTLQETSDIIFLAGLVAELLKCAITAVQR